MPSRYLGRPTPSMVPLMGTGCRIGSVGSACQVVKEQGSDTIVPHPGIRHVSFFDVIDDDPERVQRTVMEEVGWTSPDPDNSWRFDCTIKLLLGHLYRAAWGFTADHDDLSAKIREGYITREQALAALPHDHPRGRAVGGPADGRQRG